MNLRSSILTSLAFSVLLLCSVFAASNVHAGLVVTMTGTIEDGTLNGNSLNGQGFTVTADLLDGVDLYTVDNVSGIFSVTAAVIRFSQASESIFDPSRIYFSQSFTPLPSGADGDFVVAFIDRSTPPFDDFNQFGYQHYSSLIPAYNPNAISAFAYSDFRTSFSYSGIPAGSARFENGANSLQLTSLGLANASFVSTVPEPSGLAVMTCASVCFLLRRRKRNRFTS